MTDSTDPGAGRPGKSRNLRISLGLVAAFVVGIGVIALVAGLGGDDDAPSAVVSTTTAPSAAGGAQPRVVAADPRRLGPAGGGGVTLTEFLDFECEACGAAYPAIEELRRAYAGRVTFQIRYFPLPGHANSGTAAIAVEAAAQQGELEPMYRRMFETQPSWGEQRESKAALFREFAEDLGLDMDAFDAAVADPATAARVERDLRAGVALGVEGTPTFFVDERRIAPESFDDLRRELDAALAAG